MKNKKVISYIKTLLSTKAQQGFLLLLILTSCEPKQPIASKSFYYWKTQFEGSEQVKHSLDSLEVQKLYVHFFDLDWDENRDMAIPLAEIEWKNKTFPVKQIVPTIFITNRTFEHLSEKDIPDLTHKILAKIDYHCKEISLSPTEIQIDCDWTDKTRFIYFALLTALKKEIPSVPLSATIRLHQLKHFQRIGIPPVDRGMLMCYNLGDVRKAETENSILTIADLKKYVLPPVKYPIPLDIALPIFNWGVVRRNDKTVHLLNDFAITEENKPFYTEISPTIFSCDSSHYEKGIYLYKEDIIRIESVSDKTLTEAYTLLKPFVKDNSTITFYHLSHIYDADFRRFISN